MKVNCVEFETKNPIGCTALPHRVNCNGNCPELWTKLISDCQASALLRQKRPIIDHPITHSGLFQNFSPIYYTQGVYSFCPKLNKLKIFLISQTFKNF